MKNRLKVLRAERGWTQAQLALELDVSRQTVNAIEAYIQFTPGLITDDGDVTVKRTEEFLQKFMNEFAEFIARVLSVLPRGA